MPKSNENFRMNKEIKRMVILTYDTRRRSDLKKLLVEAQIANDNFKKHSSKDKRSED